MTQTSRKRTPREGWLPAHDKVLQDLIEAAKDSRGHVSKAAWHDVAEGISKATGIARTAYGIRHRATKLGISSTGLRSSRSMVSAGKRWKRPHDRVLHRLVRESLNSARQITSNAVWKKIAQAVSQETGVSRTVASVRSRATNKRWCKPLLNIRPHHVVRAEREALAAIKAGRPQPKGVLVAEDSQEQLPFAKVPAVRKPATEPATAKVNDVEPPRRAFESMLKNAVGDEVTQQLTVQLGQQLHVLVGTQLRPILTEVVREAVHDEVAAQLKAMFS